MAMIYALNCACDALFSKDSVMLTEFHNPAAATVDLLIPSKNYGR
jgi:hypothetical protein